MAHTQSRYYCKRVVACFFGVVLLLVVILYGASRTSSILADNMAKAVRSQLTNENQIVLPTLGPSSPERKSDEAYVALQYGVFFLGLRVLGQSLKDSGTTRDMVALCMPDVPTYQREILKKDGWIVKSVDPLPKFCIGNHVYSRHFVKVQMWLLTEYRRVISLDSDAIVLRNIDALFSCGEFCAAYRHSDLFNTGVVVLKPSVDTFKNICTKIQSIGSYTNGDQGFLNYFYEELKYAPMFSQSENAIKQQLPFQRLPAEYNGDVSIFYLVNKWVYLDTDEPHVLHYTLGPVKPWVWWTYPLFSLNWRWKALRDKLPPTSLKEPSLGSLESWIPLAVLLAVGLCAKLWCKHYTSVLSNGTVMRWATKLVSPVGGYFTKAFPTLALLLASYWTFSFIPLTMNPLAAWSLYGMWILLFFSIPYSLYCHMAYIMGAHSGSDNNFHSLILPRVLGEALLWFVLSVFIFYMQFSIPSSLQQMKWRSISFIGLGVTNILLCYWYGCRLVGLCYKLGAGTTRY